MLEEQSKMKHQCCSMNHCEITNIGINLTLKETRGGYISAADGADNVSLYNIHSNWRGYWLAYRGDSTLCQGAAASDLFAVLD